MTRRTPSRLRRPDSKRAGRLHYNGNGSWTPAGGSRIEPPADFFCANTGRKSSQAHSPGTSPLTRVRRLTELDQLTRGPSLDKSDKSYRSARSQAELEK